MGSLEEPYKTRAVPPGTALHLSWLFADRSARDPLLGAYALMAEWRALSDPATESAAAQMKLTWWSEELGRLSAGAPLHPITRYLGGLPGAARADATPLRHGLEAVAAQVAGAPLERAGDLRRHATALYGAPLAYAAALAGMVADETRLRECLAALAEAQYLAKVVAEYGREARGGRIAFVIEELLAAGIDNEDLLAREAPARLSVHLEELRTRSAAGFSTARGALAAADRGRLRHLIVLAELGGRRVQAGRNPAVADFRLGDLYNAWSAARRAANAR